MLEKLFLQGAVEMADAALWLYGVAFEELRRQVAGECRERGELLAACWCACQISNEFGKHEDHELWWHGSPATLSPMKGVASAMA